MNNGFRQRLIGACVLICLGAILWPWLFSDQALPVIDQRSQIPPVPAFSKTETPPPQRVKAIEPAPTLDRPQTRLREPAAESATQPVLDAQSLPQSWVLQVASFSDPDKAVALVQKLRAQGYKAFSREVARGGKRSTRVLIGPALEYQRMQTMKAAIDKQYQVDAIVLRYMP